MCTFLKIIVTFIVILESILAIELYVSHQIYLLSIDIMNLCVTFISTLIIMHHEIILKGLYVLGIILQQILNVQRFPSVQKYIPAMFNREGLNIRHKSAHSQWNLSLKNARTMYFVTGHICTFSLPVSFADVS